MARAAKKGGRGGAADDDQDEHGGEGHNRPEFDGEVLAGYLEDVRAAEERMAKRMADASKKNQADRKMIAARTKELTESGYESKVLATVRRKAKLEHKVATIDATLDDDQKETFAQMVEALGEFGDTPLGKAAISKRKGGD